MTHTTNYRNAFIRIAADSPAREAQAPPQKASGPTVANIQFDMLLDCPYMYSSDDVVFEVYARKQGLQPAQRKTERERFFSKGQACLRTSPLAKRYGWGIHSDGDGKVALVPAGTPEYDAFAVRTDLEQIPAMRSSRKA